MKNEIMVGMYHLQNQMELLESMIANLSCGNVTDDKEKEKEWIDRMWSLSAGIIEYTKLIERMIENDDRLVKQT